MLKPLSHFADIHYGKSPAEVIAVDGVVPVFGTGGVYERATRALLQGPAIIVARKGTLGQPNFVEAPFWPSDTTYAVMPKANVDPRWLFLQLALFDLSKLNEATGVPSISRDWLAKTPIHEHREFEQTAIAEIIFSVEGQIEKTEALIAKQEKIRAGLLQELFTRGVDETGALRPPRETAPDLYHQTELGWLPKGWEVKSLSTLAGELITYGIVQAGPDIEDGVPYIRTGDMNGSELSAKGLLRTSKLIASQFKRSTVRTGEIVLAIRATVGKTLPVPECLDGANLTQGTARFSPARGVDQRYALWLLRSTSIQRQIDINTKGTTFSEITLADLRQVRAAVTFNTKEQMAIAHTLDNSDQVHNAYRSELIKLRALKSALMQDLLTGRVSVAPLLQGQAV